MLTYDEANAVQKAMRRLGASGPGSWLFVRVLHHIDRPVHRLTRGRATFTSLLTGLPIVMLTTTGARTGKPRTVPLIGLPTPAGLAVIGSRYGRPQDPAWCHNLRAHPDATAVLAGERSAVRAQEVDGEQRAEVWATGLRVYPGWTTYEKRARGRRIPVFVLTRRDSEWGS